MTRWMIVAAISLVIFSVAAMDVFLGSTLISLITEWVEPGGKFGHDFHISMLELHVVMGSVTSLISLVMLWDQKQTEKAKKSPVIIELSHNTVMGRWRDYNDVLIGAPFSDERDVVADGKVLLRAINSIVKTYSEKKGGWAARIFVEIRLTTDKGEALSQGETALIEKIIAHSFAENGVVVA